MQIVFFGTPEFSAKVLQYLIDNQVKVLAVITKPDRPKGRSGHPVPTPVKLVAQAQNPPIPVHQPELVSALEFADILRSYPADLFVVVAYGEILKQHILDMPPKGCINVHTSLLPKYRGAAPIQRSIINGETETGVTIMYMVRKMDAGDIIKVVKVALGPDTTFGELEKILCEVGGVALLEVIHQIEQRKIQRVEQDHSKATLAPKIELEDCEIKWNLSAQAIHNLVRGVNPYPGAWCFVKINGIQKRLKILTTRISKDSGSPPGAILSFGKNGLIIACGEGSLQILELQLEGKKAMTAEELMRGLSKENLTFQETRSTG